MDETPSKMSDYERAIRLKLRDNFEHYASKCLKIRSKDGSIRHLKFNRVQRYLHSRLEEQLKTLGRVRALVVKGRQQGASTYIGGRFYHRTTHSYGMQTFILTHALDATQNLYRMAQRYYLNTPELVRPQVTTNNAKELLFGGLDSGYKIGTAENKSVGRSSTIQLFHGSEVAYWNNAEEHAKGILQAVPDEDGTEIILESTANGVGNYFHQMWQKAEAGESEFIAVFLPWYWQEEYVKQVPQDFVRTNEESELAEQYELTDEQLMWRRAKIAALAVNGADGVRAFRQEYPNNSTEAFQLSGEDTYIPPDIVMKARKADVEAYGALVLAVDPARFGDDRTAIIRRRGRKAYGLETYRKKDTMEIVGIVKEIIEKENPWRVCIDVGGLGAGIVDRLYELGHRERVVAVNAGGTPYNGRRYFNKRAEMWGELKEWLYEIPCEIPDSDELHADLCTLKYKVDSNSRLRIESKEDAKKRGIRSPDTADSLCLTFALPTSTLETFANQNVVSKKLAQGFKEQLNAISRAC